MDVRFFKDEKGFYQKITEIIHAETETVFEYLATNKISKWFPELSYQQIDNEEKLVFDMGLEGPNETLDILEKEADEFLQFEWGDGYVSISLEPTENGTLLTLDEFLTPLFPNIAKDFTGWYYQVRNIRTISETDETDLLNLDEFNKREAKIAATLSTLGK